MIADSSLGKDRKVSHDRRRAERDLGTLGQPWVFPMSAPLRETIAELRRLEAEAAANVGEWIMSAAQESAVKAALPELLRAAEAWASVWEAHGHENVYTCDCSATEDALIAYRRGEGKTP